MQIISGLFAVFSFGVMLTLFYRIGNEYLTTGTINNFDLYIIAFVSMIISIVIKELGEKE